MHVLLGLGGLILIAVLSSTRAPSRRVVRFGPFFRPRRVKRDFGPLTVSGNLSPCYPLGKLCETFQAKDWWGIQPQECVQIVRPGWIF